MTQQQKTEGNFSGLKVTSRGAKCRYCHTNDCGGVQRHLVFYVLYCRRVIMKIVGGLA